MELRFVEAHRVKEFSFVERQKRKAKAPFKEGTPWNCDGEIMWLKKDNHHQRENQEMMQEVTVKTFRQLARVFARGPIMKQKT